MKHRPFLLSFLVFLFLCLVGTFVRIEAARASTTFVVDRIDDDASATACTAEPNDCSLRGAIIAANATAGDVTILLPSGTYTLTIGGADEDASATGDLDITHNVVINGMGANSTIIDGNGMTLSDRVLQTFSATVEISGITIRNGYAGLVNYVSTSGGGIHNSGILTLTDAIVSGNYATGGGGGIVNPSGSTLVIIRSTVCSNSSGLGAAGIANDGSLTLRASTISSNSTPVDGGGLANGATAAAVIVNSAIISNTATIFGRGGGIFNGGGSVTLTNSTISENSTNQDGGGIYNYGFSFSASSVSLNNVTLANNTADSDGDDSGNGGGIATNNVGTLNIENSILARNIGAAGQASDCSGTLTSQGYNLIQTTSGCTIAGVTTGNLTGADANLGPLQDNGGPTLTRALQPGSPAIDAGNNATCLETDQRGFPRPVDGNNDGTAICDMGAYEVQVSSDLIVIKHVNPDPVQAGAQLTYTLCVTNTGSVDLHATITDTLPAQLTSGRTSSGTMILPNQPFTWTAIIPTGGVWTETIVGTVAWNYSGTLTNVVQVTTLEGAAGIYTATSQSQVTPALQVTKHADHDPVRAGVQLTYTIRMTNTGNVDLHATITDTLPDHVTPIGTFTWTTNLPAPDGVWVQTVIVTVTRGYSGTLTNRVQVTTLEGADSETQVIVNAIGYQVYLPVMLK
jgi:uncharacterized repeat protein (TIGR01451 family)